MEAPLQTDGGPGPPSFGRTGVRGLSLFCIFLKIYTIVPGPLRGCVHEQCQDPLKHNLMVYEKYVPHLSPSMSLARNTNAWKNDYISLVIDLRWILPLSSSGEDAIFRPLAMLFGTYEKALV